jgi:hypothetical protein
MTTKLMSNLTNPSVVHKSSNFKWLEIKEHTFGTNVAATLQNIIFKDTEALENVQRNKKKGKGEFTGCQVNSN